MAFGLPTFIDFGRPESLLDAIKDIAPENTNLRHKLMTPDELKNLLSPDDKLVCPFCSQEYETVKGDKMVE
ncbi:hypothetical protein M1146_05980, partial [Patescibacteria group bacterium]|nr:hypothetical protein [Patescibacteria group bacterium]